MLRRRPRVRRARRRLDRVAFCGPLPPAASGVATYDRAVLDGLERIGFPLPIDSMWPVDIDAASRVPTYRLAVYQMGNSIEHHLEIFRALWSQPGLVVLHDLAIDGFVEGLAAGGDDGYACALLYRDAIDAAERLRSPDVAMSEPLQLPLVAAVARRARGIIVHAPFGRRYLEEIGCRTPIYVVPHPVVETAAAVDAARGQAEGLRAAARARGADTLVVAPGELNGAKGIDAILRAAASLPPGIEIVLVGRNPAFDVGAAIRDAGVGDRVRLEMDTPDPLFLAWIAAADVVVELRHPHRGEVSGSLARALQLARPAIVSGTGTYLDAPAGAVVAIAPGPPDPAELAAAIGTLAEDPERRARMGEAGRVATAHLVETEATAHGYAEAMTGTLRIMDDPMRVPMERWAGALRDIGVTDAHVAAGYGLSYVRAAETLADPP